jgi:hypothetical protein
VPERKPVCPHATGTSHDAPAEDEPQIALRFPKGTSYRVVKATLHKLAAEIELATPAGERWCVNTEDFNESGRVYLELADATPAEAARGMAMLKTLVG